jgi:hypothetical protein
MTGNLSLTIVETKTLDDEDRFSDVKWHFFI